MAALFTHWCTGAWPVHQIDHMLTVALERPNRIQNLRDVDETEPTFKTAKTSLERATSTKCGTIVTGFITR